MPDLFCLLKDLFKIVILKGAVGSIDSVIDDVLPGQGHHRADDTGKDETYAAGKLTYEGAGFDVEAAYKKAAKIPEDAKISVKEIKEKSNPEEYKKYYDNYLSKCNFERHAMKALWDEVKYYLPNITKTFETADGDFVIIVKKPHSKVYPLTSILEYFDGRIEPQYVASIMTRLYKSAIYFDLRGFSHNALLRLLLIKRLTISLYQISTEKLNLC